MNKEKLMTVKVIKEEDLKLEQSLHLFETERVAYIRKTTKDSLPIWTIHSSQGDAIGYAIERDTAKEIARQNNFTTVSLH